MVKTTRPTDSEIRQFDTFVDERQQVAAYLQQFVVPVFKKMPTDEVEQIGTGFFVSKGQEAYFISAAHVFRDADADGAELCFYMKTDLLRKLSGRRLLPPAKMRGLVNDDRVDVGVLHMSGAGIPPYPDVGKIAVPFEKLTQSHRPLAGQNYMLIGFPVSKAKLNRSAKEIVSPYWPTGNVSVPVEQYGRHGLSPDTHIIMPWKKRKIRGRGLSRISSIKFNGVSGSPLFALREPSGSEVEEHVTVAGVFIEHRHNDSVLVATNIREAIGMIDQLGPA